MRIEDDVLVVEHFTIFKDGSGRSNFRLVTTFKKRNPDATITNIELRSRFTGDTSRTPFREVHVSIESDNSGWHDLLRSDDMINWKRVGSEPVRSLGELTTIIDWEGTQGGSLAFYRSKFFGTGTN